jgi:integrase
MDDQQNRHTQPHALPLPSFSQHPFENAPPQPPRYVVQGPNGWTLEVNSLAEQLQALQAIAQMTGFGMNPGFNAGFNPGFNSGMNPGMNPGFPNPAFPPQLPFPQSHAQYPPSLIGHASTAAARMTMDDESGFGEGRAPASRRIAHSPWDPARFERQVAPVVDRRLLTELMDEYLAQLPATAMLNDKGQYECAFALKLYLDITGDRPLTGVTRLDAQKFVRMMERWPKNASKIGAYRDLSPAQVIETANQLDAARLSPVTINNRVGYVRGFFEYVRLTNGLRFNPFDSVALPAPVAQFVRMPFSDSDLAAIFDPKNLKRLLAPQAYWLPVLAHYTGGRLRELSQLYLDDIDNIVGIPVVHFADRFPGQRLKTWSSKRVMPLHPDLDGLGFYQYVAFLRDMGHKHLFPGMPWFKDDAGFLIGKRLNETYYPKVCGLDDGMTFHCHRHHFINQASRSGLADPDIARLTGHALDAPSVIRTNYIQSSTLAERYAHLQSISFGTVVIPSYNRAQFDPYFVQVARNERLVKNKKAPHPLRVITNPPRSKPAMPPSPPADIPDGNA